MKHSIEFKFLVATAILALTATAATAKSWRINNDVTKKANFTSINDAMSSEQVQPGDTLYLDPGCVLTTQQGVNKQVTIIGPGYFRTTTPHPFAYINAKFIVTAPKTKVEGVIFENTIYIRAQYVTIERCKTQEIYGDVWNDDMNAQYANIRQCYINGKIHGNNKETTSQWRIENNIYDAEYGIYYLHYAVIRNNFLSSWKSNGPANSQVLSDLSNATIINNILIHSYQNYNVFRNVTNSIVTNNVMSCEETAYPEYTSDNRFTNSTDWGLVVSLEGINDEVFQLKDDSPAKGYATDEGDCGPFGGLHPYVLGGLPAGVPYYTKSVIDSRSKDGKINVSLNIKMQDE